MPPLWILIPRMASATPGPILACTSCRSWAPESWRRGHQSDSLDRTSLSAGASLFGGCCCGSATFFACGFCCVWACAGLAAIWLYVGVSLVRSTVGAFAFAFSFFLSTVLHLLSPRPG